MKNDKNIDISFNDYYFIAPTEDKHLNNFKSVFSFFSFNAFNKFLNEQNRQKKPLIILISGPSIVGKSSIAIEISKLLGIRSVVSTDIIRLIIEKYSPRYSQIASHRSFQCWKVLSKEFTPYFLIKGFEKQCDIISQPIKDVCLSSIINVQNTIVEGIHLTPKVVSNLTETLHAYIVPLFILASKEHLNNILLPNRTKSTYMHRPQTGYRDRLDKFYVLLDWWFMEVDKYGFHYIMNDCSPENLLSKSLKEISSFLFNNQLQST